MCATVICSENCKQTDVLKGRVCVFMQLSGEGRACFIESDFPLFTFNSDLGAHVEGGLGYRLETSFLYVY